MGEVFLPDDLHLVLHSLLDRRSKCSIPPPATLYGSPVEGFIGLPVCPLLETGEDDAAKIPTHKTSFGHLEGITDCQGGMGKLVDHGLDGIQEIVLPAGVLTP
ncbi:hypothetical protein ES703_124435 [subsurface metagenome]